MEKKNLLKKFLEFERKVKGLDETNKGTKQIFYRNEKVYDLKIKNYANMTPK